MLFFLTSLSTATSDNLSNSLPKIMCLDLIFTLSHIHFVTSALSPVKTITRMPALFILSTACFALSLGGSKKPMKPINIMFFSSFTSKS